MRVAVGSENPVKVEATERVVADLWPETRERDRPAVVDAVVESGVADQPTGRTETIAGAENRAARALESTEKATYGVGIEGGVARLADRPGLYLIMWAAVTDGERLERAAGPSLRLPDPVADGIREGGELGPVLDELLGTDSIGEGGGAAGALTGQAIDRESGLAHAVAGAFGPFVVDLYE